MESTTVVNASTWRVVFFPLFFKCGYREEEEDKEEEEEEEEEEEKNTT